MTRRGVMLAMGTALAVVAGPADARAQPASIPAPTGRVHVVALVDVDPSNADRAAALLDGHAREARRAPGCLRFELVRQAPPTANHFALLQAWESLAARNAYAEAAGTKRFRAALLPLSASPFDERLYWDALP